VLRGYAGDVIDALVGLDIETTGLDPETDRVRAVALAASEGTQVLVSDDEVEVLLKLEDSISAVASDVTIVTWNGEEFDMPFLATRFERMGVPSSLHVVRTASVGKYGRCLFQAEWGPRRHVDIAPFFKERASSLGVSWNLKPVARAVLGIEPVEVDRSGSSIARLDPEELRRYVASDAEITLRLATRLGASLEPA
jgi:DNA polymerase elongation subunit (family B)